VSYMKKLGEAVAFMLLLSTTGAAAQAVADEEPFDYTMPQVVYVEPAETLQDRYGNAGPLAEMALQYDFQLEMEVLRTEAFEAKAKLIQVSEEAEADLYYSQQESVDDAITALWSHIGTPYGFGNSPVRWDCSGLTQWYLYHRGFTDVIHSATAQVRDYRSTIVDAPIAGDLVAFQKSGSSSYFHIGVYVGGGQMIHAANPDKDTVLQAVDSFADSENAKVVYLRW